MPSRKVLKGCCIDFNHLYIPVGLLSLIHDASLMFIPHRSYIFVVVYSLIDVHAAHSNSNAVIQFVFHESLCVTGITIAVTIQTRRTKSARVLLVNHH